MAWTDIPLSHIHFGLFSGSSPAPAAVNVSAANLLLFRYKEVAKDTLVVDFKIAKAFFTPTTAAVTGMTMALNIPFGSVYFPAIGAPNSFNDEGQTFANTCAICLDPGGLSYTPGCVVVLNEASHKLVLMLRNIPGTNLNAGGLGVIGAFGQITFEVVSK